MPHDVFISYSKDDKPTALALCNKLESSGVRCWIAPRDVAPGVEWGGAIIEAIEGSRVMVLIFSLKANNSKHVHREVHRAFAKNLTVIPVRIENVRPTGTLEYYLGSVHWLDAMSPPIEKHLETVAKQVKALLLPQSVVETATRLAAQSPPAASQSTNPSTDVPLQAPPRASEARSNPHTDSPPSPSRPPPAPPASAAGKRPPVPREKRLAADIPRTPSPTTDRPTDSRVRVPLDFPEAQRDPYTNIPPSPPRARPTPPASTATQRPPVPWGQIVRNVGAFISKGHPVQRKGILVSVVLLGVANLIVAAILREAFGAPALLAFACLLGLVLLQTGILFGIGWRATEKMWLHLFAVAIGVWLILSGVYAISDLGGFREWGLLVLGICLSVGSGGAFSMLAKRSQEEKLSRAPMVAAGVGLLVSVCVVLVIAFAITHRENIRAWEDRSIKRQGRPPPRERD